MRNSKEKVGLTSIVNLNSPFFGSFHFQIYWKSENEGSTMNVCHLFRENAHV